MQLLLDLLAEGAERAYKRKNNQITRYYRCTSGPKKGKLASDPSKCGIRPDPKRVRHGRKVAKQKASIRVRKSVMSKKRHISKRVTQLNKTLRSGSQPTKTTEFYDVLSAIPHLMLFREFDDTNIEMLEEAMNHTDSLVSNGTLTLERLLQIMKKSGYSGLQDIQYIDDITVISPGRLRIKVSVKDSSDPEVSNFFDIIMYMDSEKGEWTVDL